MEGEALKGFKSGNLEELEMLLQFDSHGSRSLQYIGFA
jgi:hypothetical protein